MSAFKAGPGKRSQSFRKVGISVISRGTRVRVREFAALVHHCLENSLISLTEAGQERTRTSVKKASSVLVDEVDTLSSDNAGEQFRPRTVKENVLSATDSWVFRVVHVVSFFGSFRPKLSARATRQLEAANEYSETLRDK